uniref:G protein-coupled receptor n=1 Tax=Romanomermis culicivorax TaxID=13658 RepID=A0A915KDN2_ROMCU
MPVIKARDANLDDEQMLLSLSISDLTSVLFSTFFSVPCIFANFDIFPTWFDEFGGAASHMAYRIMIYNVFFTAWNSAKCYSQFEKKGGRVR